MILNIVGPPTHSCKKKNLTSAPSVSGSNCRVGWSMRVTWTLVAMTFAWPRLRICLVSSWGFRILTVPEEMETHLLTCSKAQWSSVLMPMMEMVVCCSSAIRPAWENNQDSNFRFRFLFFFFPIPLRSTISGKTTYQSLMYWEAWQEA